MTSSTPRSGSSPYNPDAATRSSDVPTPETTAMDATASETTASETTAVHPTHPGSTPASDPSPSDLLLGDPEPVDARPAGDGHDPAVHDPAVHDPAVHDPAVHDPAVYDPAEGDEHDGAQVAAASGTAADTAEKPAPVKRGTSDLGLLLLRLALGVLLLGAGARQLFGWFDGPGITEFTSTLDAAGYRFPGVSAYVASITELVAGVLLVLGLLAPLAGAAALVTLINAWLLADLAEPGFRFFAANGGQQYEMLLVVVAAVVILSGPGRYSLDVGRGWATRPFIGSFVALLVGVGGGLAAWFVLNGATPFS